jgi:poly-gamma-glutamate capsule biosynthesis protein CapA/YwtB (metallophosphatase superfamily)
MKSNSGLIKILIGVLVVIVVIGAAYGTYNLLGNNDGETAESENSGEGGEASSDSEGGDEDSGTSKITISTVGDIMVHDEQYWGAYDEESDSYDFNPVFEYVKPYLEEADLAIGNFETTLAGEERGYQGYPIFNSPDEIADAVQNAGFDTLITSNNHSMDTGQEGLQRTVQQLDERGFDVVGSYDGAPESRHVIKEVNGIKIAMLAFTEHLNGLDDPYTDEEVYNMIDVISEDNITEAIDAAKEDDPDIILTYMHWGEEYHEEPGENQQYYAQLLADQGVDLIIGSHPHVIQPTDYIESEDGEHTAFVVYSLGNFVSNQRVETISEDFAPSEDGVIMNFDIEKDNEADETTVTDINYVPTWVYRHSDTGDTPFDYEILPVQDFQGNNDLPDDILERLDRSIERTDSRLNLEE